LTDHDNSGSVKDAVTGQQEVRVAIEKIGASPDDVLMAIARAGFVCIPRQPDNEVLNSDTVHANALDEDAEGVWRAIVAHY
jgi:hypothetical protein